MNYLYILSNLRYLAAGAYFMFMLIGAIRMNKSDWKAERLIGRIDILWVVLILLDIAKGPLQSEVIILNMLAVPTGSFIMRALVRGEVRVRAIIAHEFTYILLLIGLIVSGNIIHLYLSYLYTLIYWMVFFVYGTISIRKYRKSLKESYSAIEKTELDWFNWVRWTYPIYIAVWIGVFYANNDLLYVAYYVASILLWLYFYRALASTPDQLRDKFSKGATPCGAGATFPLIYGVTAPQGAAPATTGQQYNFIESLNKVCVEEKAYLDPDLDITTLAQKIGTNRTYLSSYLNGELGMTFFDYINGLRLQYAVELMSKSDESLESIALDSGYNSMHSFRRVFAKKYGCAPSEYRSNGCRTSESNSSDSLLK